MSSYSRSSAAGRQFAREIMVAQLVARERARGRVERAERERELEAHAARRAFAAATAGEEPAPAQRTTGDGYHSIYGRPTWIRDDPWLWMHMIDESLRMQGLSDPHDADSVALGPLTPQEIETRRNFVRNVFVALVPLYGPETVVPYISWREFHRKRGLSGSVLSNLIVTLKVECGIRTDHGLHDMDEDDETREEAREGLPDDMDEHDETGEEATEGLPDSEEAEEELPDSEEAEEELPDSEESEEELPPAAGEPTLLKRAALRRS